MQVVAKGRLYSLVSMVKDNDYNCQYTIKEYHSEKDPHTGCNVKVELRPLNQDPQYKVIDVEGEDGEVRIIATLKRVLN